MPLPIIIGGIAAVAGVAGLGNGIHGGFKMKQASDTMTIAQKRQEKAVNHFNKKNSEVMKIMDDLGTEELLILSSFEEFSNIVEMIQGRPEFKALDGNDVNLPEYEAEELKKISAGAGILLGGIGGAAVGTAGGFAAAGATTSAVMAVGVASTGTAISSLSGVAATNATLAALGGGAIAYGGGGMAVGSLVLGGATLGVGVLIGGIIFNVTGIKLSDKANEALDQAKQTEREVKKIVTYLDLLENTASNFYDYLQRIKAIYDNHFKSLKRIVLEDNKTDWGGFNDEEKRITKNCILLVGLLYNMCKVKLVLKGDENDINSVNIEEIEKAEKTANEILQHIA